MLTDGELCRQAREGMRSATAELVRRWAARVVAVCHARVRRADIAEELAQETLLRAVRSLPTLENPEAFGAWVRGIADRASIDWLKSPQRSQVTFSTLSPERDFEVPSPSGNGAEAAEQKDEREHLVREVERLPDECREVVMMFYYDNLSYDQLADVLGVSRATVNARLAKARRLLRSRLTREGESPRSAICHPPHPGAPPSASREVAE